MHTSVSIGFICLCTLGRSSNIAMACVDFIDNDGYDNDYDDGDDDDDDNLMLSDCM